MQLKPVSEHFSNIVAIARVVSNHGIALETCYRIRNSMSSYASNSYARRLAWVCLYSKSMLILITFANH